MRFFVTMLLLMSAYTPGFAQEKIPTNVNRTATNDHWDFIGVNRILMWISNNGATSNNPLSNGAGLEWPQGSGKFLVFQEGLVIGGVVQGENRVGGATYVVGLQAGCILPNGSPDDPQLPAHRIYKARRYEGVWWNGLEPITRTRLLKDLAEWPVAYGAPWTDANANSIYDPDTNVWKQGGATDTPLMTGDEVLWFVSNDLDAQRTLNLYGSQPMGLEIQTMLWASNGHPLLENVVFREYTIINKGSETITDMYLGAWEDMDLGDAADDYIGVDTSLGLAYVYNSAPRDTAYGLPPASGTLWLQTPVAPNPGRTARFGLGTREGYSNLPMSGFVFYINGDPIYSDPTMGLPEGSDQMMFNLQGLFWDGAPFIDPTNSEPVRSALAGDPVLRSGWIDGIVHEANDRRSMSSCGSFTLAPGDSQKVILARLAATEGNHLLSVRELRNNARRLQDLYRNYPMGVTAPMFTSSITYPTASTYRVQVNGGPFVPNTTQVESILRSADGSEIQRVTLVDDGAHGDGLAGDGVFGGALEGNAANGSAELYCLSTTSDGIGEWFVNDGIALPGEAHLRVAEIVSDSRNFDGEANPGENVRLRLRIENNTGMTLGPWHCFLRDSMSWLANRSVLRFDIQTVANGSSEPAYNPDDAGSYLSFTIPESTPPGSILRLPVTMIAGNGCVWEDTLLLQVEAFTEAPISGLFEHVQGPASGSLGYVVVDRSALTDHDYRITIEGEDFQVKTMHVEDVTLGTTLYRGLPVPNLLAHGTQIIDGWRITLGTAQNFRAYEQNGQPHPDRPLLVDGQFSEPARAWFGLYQNMLLIGEDFFGSKLGLYDAVPVRLFFNRSHGQKAMEWLRGASPNYGYQGYFDIPLQAYDIGDPMRPRQLMVGFVEQNGGAAHDNTWRPTQEVNDREYLFIFRDDYSDVVDIKFQSSIQTSAENLDILYSLWPLLSSDNLDFEDGDSYTITPRIPVSNRDVYILANPRLLEIRTEAARPEAIALHQNYPNPFGSGSSGGGTVTSIRFDTPVEGHVRIAVYDLFGRRVAMILDQTLPAGKHRTRFDASALSSGTYVLTLDSDGQRVSRTMMVMK